jgi:hypothetical protein
MQQYIGLKLINASPMNRLTYNQLRGWDVPEDENPADEGFLVEYLDGGKANVSGYEGYVSWSPKDVFERAYRPLTGMTFGMAIEALKKGYRVARTGWNGRDMWLAYSPGANNLPADKFWAGPNRDYAEQSGGTATVLPCITMKTATGEILMGWLASQTDMLAEDWTVVL